MIREAFNFRSIVRQLNVRHRFDIADSFACRDREETLVNLKKAKRPRNTSHLVAFGAALKELRILRS